MKYSCIIFDIDGTLLDSERSNQTALQTVLLKRTGIDYELSELEFARGLPGLETAARLNISDPGLFLLDWELEIAATRNGIRPYSGVEPMLKQLRERNVRLGIVTSKTRREFQHDFVPCGLVGYFDPELIVTADDTERHKPDPAPLLEALRRGGVPPEQLLYIGDTLYDSLCAAKAGVAFGLAVWGAGTLRHIRADSYFSVPEEVVPRLDGDRTLSPWLRWAMELQFIGQAGVTYSRDRFDLERFERLREIAAEMISWKSELPLDTVHELFCSEKGFQTPKLDTRAAIFQDGRILLVEERDGLWSLPGGWVDVLESIRSNTEKEVREEAGLAVAALRLIAVQDRNRHNPPPYAYGVCKVFVLCGLIDGEFQENAETVSCAYFGEDDLPPLSEAKNTADQVRMCFAAARDTHWVPIFD